MAWNIPGNNKDNDSPGRKDSGDKGERNPWPPRRTGGGGRGGRGGGGGGFDRILDQFRGLFGGGFGGGNPLRWIAVVVVIVLLLNCFVLVGETQRGVVLRFGQVARVMQPGPNFKLPWPVERVTKVDATTVQSFSNTVPVLTRDENIVIVSFNVQYRVGDATQYLFGTRNAREMLEQTALSAVREQIGRVNLDAALNARGPISTAAQTSLQASLDSYRTGLFVNELNLQDARPPEEVKDAFDAVNSAQQMNEQLVKEAGAYAAKIVPEARGESERVRSQAEGYKTAEIARATGDATRFSLLVDAYAGAQDVTRKRLWLETVQSVLAENRVVVGGDGRQLIYVPMAGQGAGGQAAPSLIPPEVLSPAVEATRNSGNSNSNATPAAPARTLPRPSREGATR
ncbi:FtsH protease activity modulator HflK [Luteimonas fraxinea]|uniref:Protein HflK n=1 Tax=Luteimonas fraxinea TaxID=2901869 RepID=A0ABS8UJ37_9GAMM|nr:FtsH protease activity modulator HflK [Luteimonas fraxinea]MCD9098746.1 FtsH protease activity modulator HflK [Luteimonas fraxinea]MCD9127509.1 FtsH protease activity modulator HflK [Luteimonas fraxinea]UHH10402.1 FtsH protease activity modulator HflK [Luteimonas fraxinea]